MTKQSASHAKHLPLVLPALLLIATLLAGFFLVRFLERVGSRNLQEQSENIVGAMAMGIKNELHSAQLAAGAMAGSPWIPPLLLDPSSVNLANAHSVLDRYRENFGFSVCYLLDLQGNAIASSNRDAADSFIGKNYAFRPYFQDALVGRSNVYMAAGSTSNQRGFYAASPVKDPQGKVIGVAAIKKNVQEAESVMAGFKNSFFVSPQGVIFMSGSPEKVFRILWPLDKDARLVLKSSKQFTVASLEPLLRVPVKNGKEILFSGEACRIFRSPLGPPGWSLVLLAPLHTVLHYTLFGWIVTLFVGSIILLLAFWVSWRIKSQAALQESEAKYRSLFENSRDAIMVLHGSSRKFTAGNPATLTMFQVKSEEIFRTLRPADLSSDLQPDGRFSSEKSVKMIETALRDGFHFFEWTHKRFNGEEFPATVLLNRMQMGREVAIQATVRDITLQKKAEQELNQKIGELERFNRIAVGRELKMIELKEKIRVLEKGNEAAP